MVQSWIVKDSLYFICHVCHVNERYTSIDKKSAGFLRWHNQRVALMPGAERSMAQWPGCSPTIAAAALAYSPTNIAMESACFLVIYPLNQRQPVDFEHVSEWCSRR